MLRKSLLKHNKKKPKLESLEKKDDESPAAQKPEELPKHAGINTVHPLQNAKATSVSPLLSTDKSVHTDPPVPPAMNLGSPKVSRSKDEKEILQTSEKEKPDEDTNESCNLKTCPMEKHIPEICQVHLTTCAQRDSEDTSPTVNPIKLTEMINTSIKEAMETIVKQCRMEEERKVEKKPEKYLVKRVCRAKKAAIPLKVKQPRMIQEQFNNRSRISKSNMHVQRLREGAAKHHRKKGNASERKRKKHSKSTNNMKTDNRKMTGNVNIYICSEAAENTQATGKEEKPETCTESSSATTTEGSKISSSKLLASIRNKRRKLKERDSFDLPEMDESNDTSTTCSSYVSKYTDSKSAIKLESSNFIDIHSNLDNDVHVKSIESTSTECDCKDANISDTTVTIDKSDLSFEKSKFVICDALEKSFDFGKTKTIYPAKYSSLSESEEWSSKSACSSRNLDCVPSTTWSLEPNLNRINEIERCRVSSRTFESVCKYCTKDQGLIDRYSLRCACRNKKYFPITVEKGPLICNCITEEEEDDVCVNVTTSREFKISDKARKHQNICRKISKDSQESAELVPCPGHSAIVHSSPKLKEKDEKEKKLEIDKDSEAKKLEIYKDSEAKKAEEETDQQPKESQDIVPQTVTFPKLIRPETIVLQQLLKLRTPEKAIEQKDTTSDKTASPLGQSVNDTNKPKARTQVSPKILEKFNLRKESTFPEQTTVEEKQPSSETKEKEVAGKRSSKKNTAGKALENKDGTKIQNPKNKNSRNPNSKNQNPKNPNSTRQNPKNQNSENQNPKNQNPQNLQEKLKESFLFKGIKKMTGKAEDTETKTDEPAKIETEKLSENPKIELIDTLKPIEKFIPSKLYPYIPFITKEIKPELDTTEEKKKEDEKDATVDPSESIKKETEEKAKDEGISKQIEKLIPSKLHPYIPLIKKESKPESDTTEEKKKDDKKDPTVDPSKSIKKETEGKARDEIISDASKGKQAKPKALISIDKKTSPVLSTHSADTELSKQEDTEEDEKEDESRKIVKSREFRESAKKKQIEKKSDIQEKRKSALQITKTQRETPIKTVHDEHSEQASIAVDTRSSKLDSYTVCTNASYVKCPSAIDCVTVEKNTCNCCNCCYLPILQCDNEHINYPKSCLKRQCYHSVSQENNRPIPYHDKRNWEECGCRRIISCNTCCRARNDCRLTVACVNCYKPKNKCNCKSIRETKKAYECMKSMFCLYCDNPRDKCTCRGPMRKCSCCKLSVDLCICKDQKTIYDGRPVLTEPDNDRTMYVTAWKPREEVRRYFSRNLADLKTDSMNECCYCEKLKSRNSDDLPYQRLCVFSDVMDELQKKITISTCCARCKKIPCCCNIAVERDEREDRKIKYRISPKARRKIIAVCMETSKNKLLNNCKYESSHAKGDKQKKLIVALCCACQSAPCRCKKIKSNQKKPKAKCYYCKSSPCICIAARERNKSRPCRCTDSPCQTKEKETTSYGKTSTKSKNTDEKTICLR